MWILKCLLASLNLQLRLTKARYVEINRLIMPSLIYLSIPWVQSDWIKPKYILPTFLVLNNSTSKISANSQKKKLGSEHLPLSSSPLLPSLILLDPPISSTREMVRRSWFVCGATNLLFYELQMPLPLPETQEAKEVF